MLLQDNGDNFDNMGGMFGGDLEKEQKTQDMQI